MKRKRNKGLIAAAALAILATLLLTVAVCYHFFKKQIMEDLKVYAVLAESVFAQEDISSFERALGEEAVRITVVEQDGTVVYDSYMPAGEMENHGDRPEIRQAFAKGEGSRIRRSDTLDRNTYYYAKRIDGERVLRVSREGDSAYRIMEFAFPYLLSAALLLSAFGIVIRRRQEDLVQNARLRQEFTANVSHELKTPLAAISGYSELIENGMAARQEEIIRFAGEIHKNANRLLTLINDVIRLSELDGGEEETLSPVNLWEIAQSCAGMLQLEAEKHGVTLFSEGEDAYIMASRQMAEEVLYNLCDNAIRYNKKDGSVFVTVRKHSQEVLLTVKDTGIGIPGEHQDRIFERFYRVDKSRSKSTGGTGLGLAIVKHILIKLNAKLVLKSQPEKGTEITVTFPSAKNREGR